MVITNDDDDGTAGEAVLDLSVGSNTLTVTVTAQDGDTLTYTITATRADAPPAPTDCPSDTAWCTTMTLGYRVETSDSSTLERFGYNSALNFGDFGTATFTHGGTLYSVSFAERLVSSLMDGTIQFDVLSIIVRPDLPDGSVFQVDNRTFTVDANSRVNEGLEDWNLPTDQPLSWTQGQHVTVSLKLPAVPISLVSNTHLSTSLNTNHVLAQSFETGANLDGYTVSQVDIRFGYTSGKSTTVKIRQDDGGEPGDLVATLTNPASLTADSLNTFTAPAGTTLAASTTYWLTVGEGISFSTDRAGVQADAGNDQTGETGWSIGDGRLWRTNELVSWSTSTYSLLMTIKGTVVPCDGIWCATLTVQDLGDGHRGCGNASDGNECSVAAHLSEDEFTHAMTDYSVGAARVQSDGQLQLYLNRNITTDSESLVLHVGSETFAFEDANAKGSDHRKWNGSGLSWTTGDAIGLKLTDAANATGQPTISGVPQVGMVLEAKMGTIADTNGLPSGTFPSDYTFQWVRVATDSTETNLGTDSTYMVSSSDVDSTIRVDVSFTDLAGNSEGPLPSVATAAVVPAAGLCPAGNDWCATMTVGTVEAAGTYYGFFFGGIYGQLDETTIDYGHSFEVEEIYIYETESLVSDDRIHVALDADVPLGTVFNLGGTEFTSDAGSRVGSGTHIWSRPANFAWIDGQEVRVSANLAPAPESATVDGTSLVLTHSEDLDTGSVPATTAYTVKVDGAAGTNPSTVSVGTRTVTLTLATPVIDEQVVTVSYDMPASNRLQDVSGLEAPDFDNFAVTNNTDNPDVANATGNPTIAGVPQVDMMLAADTSDIEDVDGLPATFTYQWVRVATDSTENNVGTDSTYTVSASDEGSTIKVYVSFTDLAGNSEGPLPSAATAAVVPAAGPCPAGNDWCATMTVGTYYGSRTTSYGFSDSLYGQLDDPTIDYGPSFEVEHISIFEPDGFNPERIFVDLNAYVPPGTVFNLGGTKFTANAGRTATSGNYSWSRPANFTWIDGQEVRVSANLAPAPESATVDGTSLVLTHSEDLDTSSVPPASAYTIRVEPNGTTPSSVSVGTRTVTLTLATAVIDGQVVTVSYDVPASNPLQDISGRNAPDLNNFAVTNNTEAVYRGPTFIEGTDTTRVFEETFADETVAMAMNIGQPVAATDPDTGDTLTYSLRGTDAAKFAIVSTSGQLLTKVGTQYDYEQNRTYSVTVVVEDSDDNSDEITVVLNVIDQNEPPLAPTPVFVSPTSGSASKLNVSWHPPTNTGRPSINNYDIQYREVDAANYSNGPQNVSGDRTNISGLKSGTRYQVQVRATNAEGDGPWTPAVEGSTSQNSEPDPPAVTYGLRATGVSQTRIDLSWNAPTDDGGASITGYRIEVSDDGGSNWSDLVANTGNSNRTYAHTDLTAGVTRHYRVSAINRVGTGLASAVASGQTQAAGATPKRPSTMYLYFTVSNSDWNESEEVKYSGNRIDGDCSGEKYFRAFWTEPNSPPVDEWEVQATPFDGASGPSTQMRYSRGNREYPEFIGSAQFATGSGEGSYINFAVRGRYGDTWGTWGPTSVLRCNNTE